MNFTNFPVLETAQLVLRQLELTDEDAIFMLRSDESVNKYIDRPRCITKDEGRQFIHRINKFISENESIYWAITEKDKPQLIGTICYWNFRKEWDIAEVGYELHPDFQGKGIMQEALAKVIEYGFGELKLKTIEAYTAPDNDASTRLLEKFNFKTVMVANNNAAGEEMIWVLNNPSTN